MLHANSSHAIIHFLICKHYHRGRYDVVKGPKIKRSNAEDLARSRHASSCRDEQNEGNRNRQWPNSQLLKLVLNFKPNWFLLYLGLCDGTCLIVWFAGKQNSKYCSVSIAMVDGTFNRFSVEMYHK